jgi:hypothetical protein
MDLAEYYSTAGKARAAPGAGPALPASYAGYTPAPTPVGVGRPSPFTRGSFGRTTGAASLNALRESAGGRSRAAAFRVHARPSERRRWRRRRRRRGGGA